MENSVKILLSYHKPDVLFKDEILTPVHAGRETALEKIAGTEKLQWLLDNTIGDNTGENISARNSLYNEMSTVYWAWKNYAELGNPDYIGFMHYRRHFIFEDKPKSVYECLDVDEQYYEKINYSEENIKDILGKYDFVCTKPHYRDSVYEHYKKNHDIADLDCAIEILKEKYPSFSKYANQYLNGQEAYFCNMFIFPKDIFFEYAEWFFSITFELEKRMDLEGKRLFVSEWLTGIFITYLKANGLKGKFLPTMIVEGNHTIPIVLAADDNYAAPLVVAMTSILENAKKNTHYDFYVLKSGDFSEKNEKIIIGLEQKYGKTKITFLDMKQQYQDANIQIGHITAATYYRLQLPSLLPEVNKCIYIDVDAIVEDDLSELFRTSIDDKYIAGVRAPGYYYPEAHRKNHEDEIGIPIDEYINAGVLLMNLAKMRKDNLEEIFNELMNKKFSSQDQDILNVACHGKIRHLPFKYNVMTKYKVLNEREYSVNPGIKMCFTVDEWNTGRLKPAIIHYADKRKPWTYLGVDYAENWWKYALKTDLDAAVLATYIKLACDNEREILRQLDLTASHKRDLQTKLKNMTVVTVSTAPEAVIKNDSLIEKGMRALKNKGFKYTLKKTLFWLKNH